MKSRCRQIAWIMDDLYVRAGCVAHDYDSLLARSLLKSRYASIYLKTRVFDRVARWRYTYSKAAQRNRCRICGRSHYVISKAGVARLQLRFYTGQGLFGGISRTGR